MQTKYAKTQQSAKHLKVDVSSCMLLKNKFESAIIKLKVKIDQCLNTKSREKKEFENNAESWFKEIKEKINNKRSKFTSCVDYSVFLSGHCMLGVCIRKKFLSNTKHDSLKN